MSLYDINGKQIQPLSGSAVTSAFLQAVDDGKINLGEPVGATLSCTGMSDTWYTNAETAYNLMIAEMKNHGNTAIPFFIQTDQHGASNAPARWMNNKDGKVKNINLGDIMVDKFYLEHGEKYRKETKGIQNHITVYGNHDASMGYLMDGDFVNDYLLTHYFVNTTTAGKKMVNNRGFFVSYDDDFAVKYVVVSPYYMNEDGTRDGAEIRSDQMEWLLKELTVNDGYDIIILMHQLWTDTYIHRDGTVQNWQDAPLVLEDTWKVMKDRRNKRSGTITDSECVSHSYDFTDCESRILCSLHGHSHEELYLQEEGLTTYAANSGCTFGLINRDTNKVTFWQFSNSSVLEPLVLDI
jgi:hypothetical protein